MTRYLLILAAVLALAPAHATARTRDGSPSPDTLRGGSGADRLRGGGGGDLIRGGRGADVLRGEQGPDHVGGDAGPDVIVGGPGNDALGGGSGADAIAGGFGADAIFGGPGDDLLAGDNDNDTLRGGPGDDVLIGGSGEDRLDGGPGDDRIFAVSAPDNITGGRGDDEIVVTLSGLRRVSCGSGRDHVIVLVGSDERERYNAERPGSHDRACESVRQEDTPLDPMRGETYLAKIAGGEHTGTARDDTLLGGYGPDVLHGGAGDDVLWGQRQPGSGGRRPDVLDGGPGADTIFGGPGRQLIAGGDGGDRITAGTGGGTLAAGAGNDVVILRPGRATNVDLGPGDDTLRAGPRTRGTVRCGAGYDRVEAVARVRLSGDCEQVRGAARRSLRVDLPWSPDKFPVADDPRFVALVISGTRAGQSALVTIGLPAGHSAVCKRVPAQDVTLGGPRDWLACPSPWVIPGHSDIAFRGVNPNGRVNAAYDTVYVRQRSRPPFPSVTGDVVQLFLAGRDRKFVRCIVDGGPEQACPRYLRPLAPGIHSVVARAYFTDGSVLDTPPVVFPVRGSARLELAAAHVPAVVERHARLRARPPRAAFALSEPAVVTAELRRRGRTIWSTTLPLQAGPQTVALPGARLARAAAGRYDLRLRATGRDGRAAVRTLRFALAGGMR